MPITITPAPPASVFGPGLQVGLHSDLVGPISSDSLWNVRVCSDSDFDDLIWSEQFPTFGFKDGGVLLQTFGGGTIAWGAFQVQDGATVYVRASITHGFTEDDSGTLTTTYDAVSGLGMQAVFLQNALSTGLTPTQADQLAATVANTQTSVPLEIGGGDVIQSIVQLLPLIASPQIVHEHACRTITGQGSLARGSSEFDAASLGVAVHFVSVPDGFGRRLGAQDEFFNRVLQIRTIRSDAVSDLYVDQVIDLVADGQRFMWGVTVPVTVEWYVTTGCVVSLCFLTLQP